MDNGTVRRVRWGRVFGLVGAAALGVAGLWAIGSVGRDAVEQISVPRTPDVVYAGDLPASQEDLTDLDEQPDGSSQILSWVRTDQPDGDPNPEATYRADIVGQDDATADAIEGFTYSTRGDGEIEIDPYWQEEYLVTTEVPIVGRVTCHEIMLPQFDAALQELELRGLDGELDPDDWAGCYSPRHLGRDPSRSLSMHAFGLAFDVNASTNAYGAEPQLHPDVVKVFERYGFVWGGHWNTPDGMHFELGILPQELLD